jgi:hypothetical protein
MLLTLAVSPSGAQQAVGFRLIPTD